MNIEWAFQGFVLDKQTQAICGSRYRLVGTVPEVEHVLPIYEHPDDKTVYNGMTYIRKPPVWEDEADKWLRNQSEIAKSFDSFDEYATYIRTVLAIAK